MTLQSHSWAYAMRKTSSKKMHAPRCLPRHCLQWPTHGVNIDLPIRGVEKEGVVYIYNGTLLRHQIE